MIIFASWELTQREYWRSTRLTGIQSSNTMNWSRTAKSSHVVEVPLDVTMSITSSNLARLISDIDIQENSLEFSSIPSLQYPNFLQLAQETSSGPQYHYLISHSTCAIKNSLKGEKCSNPPSSLQLVQNTELFHYFRQVRQEQPFSIQSQGKTKRAHSC